MIPIPQLRLEAARNLGLTAPFRVKTGRDFTGTVADYSDLAPREQLSLTDEMLKIIRQSPEEFTAAQVQLAKGQTRAYTSIVPGIDDKTAFQAALEGAKEGLVNVSSGIAQVAAPLNSTLTRVAVIGGIALAGYLIFTYAPKPRKT